MDLKTTRYQFMMSELDAAMLQELAEATGESAATVVRLAVRDTYRARFGDRKPKVKRQ